MKILKSIVIVLFVVILSLPIIFFNFDSESISKIDNRKLSPNPFRAEGDLMTNMENYVNDRIGFRDEIITEYTILNDKLFGIMEHPSYSYGKDGYVFGAGVTVYDSFGNFHIAFANMVKSIQNYCLERGKPFIFVFNPAKPAVYQEKIASGIKYNRKWVDRFFNELDKLGVYYVDNTKTFIDLKKKGINGFNVKYDANHWNDTGAFYGTNEMLLALESKVENIHVNNINEFNVSYENKDSLLVSNFPIDEDVPLYKAKVGATTVSKNNYVNLILDSQYRGFGHYVNKTREEEGAPKALVFQGSYMNSYGYKFLANAFGEYIYVHDYQNVINFPYYYNVFQPDCVIFEVAEYTFANKYFNYDKMLSIDFNPTLSSECSEININMNDLVIKQQDNTLTTLEYVTDNTYKYVWLKFEDVYDMKKSERGYEVTIKTEVLNSSFNAKVYVNS